MDALKRVANSSGRHLPTCPSNPRRLALSVAVALGLLCSHVIATTVSALEPGLAATVAEDVWGGDLLLNRWRQVLSARVDKGEPAPSVFEQAFTAAYSSKDPGEVERTLGQYEQLMTWVEATPAMTPALLALVPEFNSTAAMDILHSALRWAKDPSKEPAAMASALTAISDQLAKLSAAPSHGYPAIRRILIGTLLKKRVGLGGRFPPAVQTTVDTVMLQLFALHKRSAAFKGAVQFFHVSKSGGTNLCQAAEANGCSSKGFDTRTNCLLREFNDVPRWVTFNAHKYVQYRMSSRQALPWFVNFHTFRPTLSCALRHAYLLQNNLTFYANEYTNPAPGPEAGGATSEMCSEFVNLIMFRHPHDRLKSQIGWVEKLYKEFYVDVDTQRCFLNRTTGFWERLMPAGVNNYFIRSLLGQRFFEYPVMQVLDEHVTQAKLATLQHDILLILENRARNDLAMRVGLGWSAVLQDGAIRSSSELGDAVALPLDYDTMLERNQPDVEVYGFAKEMQALDTMMWNFVTVADEQLGLENLSSDKCGYVAMGAPELVAARYQAAAAVEIPAVLLSRLAFGGSRSGNDTDGAEGGEPGSAVNGTAGAGSNGVASGGSGGGAAAGAAAGGSAAAAVAAAVDGAMSGGDSGGSGSADQAGAGGGTSSGHGGMYVGGSTARGGSVVKINHRRLRGAHHHRA